ncbi:MAG TPA: DNA-processing protein DprA [Candidatus Methanoperedens sp.]|nr:DNA-processing protein DprA [Candidatus Methanoperedens sp.]
MTNERILTIGLNTLPGLRAGAAHAAFERFGAAAAILAAPVEALTAVRGIGPGLAAAVHGLDAARAGEAEERRARDQGASILTLADPGYPARLRSIPDPPRVLYLRGTLAPGDDNGFAVVGARAATAYGRTIAGRLARGIAAAGLPVVSGLARGIDGCAHRGALAAGGRTLAVLGAGLDRLYPPEHARLADEVAASGALISEFPCGAEPEAWHFPLRNRVISGLARGVVVVEAAERSGALVTADMALEQGRDVFAVPGPVTSPLSAGPNRLIRQGAGLVGDAGDLLEAFPDLAQRLPATAAATVAGGGTALDERERRLLEVIGAAPRPIDDIIRDCAGPAASTTALLTALELRGLVQQYPGKIFARI